MNPSQSLAQFSVQELVSRTKNLSDHERKLTAEIIRHLGEIYKRRIHLELGYGSLHDFCVHELGYSHGAASRRVHAVQLSQDLPELPKKIETGEVTLAQVTMVSKFFKEERKETGRTFTPEQKTEIIQHVAQSTQRDSEKYLVSISSFERPSQPDQEKVISAKETLLQFTIDEQTRELLQRVREVASAKLKNTSQRELIKLMAEAYLKHHDPLQKAQGALQKTERISQSATTPPRSNIPENLSEAQQQSTFRYVPAAIKHRVVTRDQGRCVYIDPKTKKRCDSMSRIELDHITPVALGGRSTAENLRCLCRAHNLFVAQRILTEKVMGRYLET